MLPPTITGECVARWALCVCAEKGATSRAGLCRRRGVKLLLVFKRGCTAGQTPVLPVCLPLTESSSLCDRQFYQSVELLKHKTPGTPACLQPQRAKKHRPHWVTASALAFFPPQPPSLTSFSSRASASPSHFSQLVATVWRDAYLHNYMDQTCTIY